MIIYSTLFTISVREKITTLVFHPPVYGAQSHLTSTVLGHTSYLWRSILAPTDPLQLLVASSEFPNRAGHSFAVVYRRRMQREPAGSNGAR